MKNIKCGDLSLDLTSYNALNVESAKKIVVLGLSSLNVFHTLYTYMMGYKGADIESICQGDKIFSTSNDFEKAFDKYNDRISRHFFNNRTFFLQMDFDALTKHFDKMLGRNKTTGRKVMMLSYLHEIALLYAEDFLKIANRRDFETRCVCEEIQSLIYRSKQYIEAITEKYAAEELPCTVEKFTEKLILKLRELNERHKRELDKLEK